MTSTIGFDELGRHFWGIHSDNGKGCLNFWINRRKNEITKLIETAFNTDSNQYSTDSNISGKVQKYVIVGINRKHIRRP